MNTAYTSTTTVQDAHTRYNALLAQALERIKARKADKTVQEPEEVATTATDVTTTATQQPEPVATPEPTGTSEEVTTEPTEASKPQQVTTTRKTTTTRRTKTASPKPLGRDIYHIFAEKLSKWAIMFDKSVYHDPEGFALLSDNVVLIESKLDYKEEYSGKLIQEDGAESKKDMQLFSKYYKDICRPAGGKYAVTPKEIEERIKGEEFARKKRVICSILESDDVTDEEVKIHLKNNKDVRNYVNEQTKYQFVKLLFPAGESIYLYTKHLKRALKVAKILSTNSISDANNILQLTGEAGRIIVAGCITRPEDENSMNPLIIDLADATPAPADTPAIEEATPVTAPQATEEVTTEDDTTTAPEATAETPVQEPEDVTTEESPEMTVEQEDDNAPVLRYFIERGGNACANYLDTLNYTQATERVYREKRGARTKVTERYYTKKDGTLYGLYRSYTRNGKRATFVVVKDRRLTERRTYGKNNNSYKADIQYNGVKIVYNVTDGLVTRAELTRDDNTISVVFDDTNRPATPRDLPAPAPTKTTSKETTKGAPAMPVQEQPNSKPDLTPETTTVPEEVKEVTTSKQEDDTVPYWLLLDNELRAQQDEQEPATPEKYEDEPEKPMHAPQMLKKMIEEHKKRIKDGTATESIYNADALQTEVLTPKRAKELLGDDASDYKTYILVDGKHLVETNRPTLKKTLYIDDESKEYKEYLRGNISKVELYRDDMMSMYGSKGKIKDVEENPATLTVDGTKDKVLSFNLYRRADYGYRKANPDEVEIYKAAMRANHEAFSKRLDSYIKRYGSKIYVHSYWANR